MNHHNKIYVIAEIGINHNGNLDQALELIKIAKDAGADCVKFQKRTPDICVPDDQKNILRETPWGTLTYLQYKKVIEFGKKEYDVIDRYCNSIGIDWTASVWDIPSFEFLSKYQIPFVKIPSACITDVDLLSHINSKSYNTIMISTGMSTSDQIDRAVQLLKNKIWSILWCNSSYPSTYNEIDINVLSTLRESYPNLTIGYSGHEVDLLPTIVACSAGAKIVERHVTFDKTAWGTDHKCSLEPHELTELIKNIRNIETILGKSEITVYPSEIKIAKKLRNVD
jgi:sialic acid synthase SpsE